MSLGTIYSSDGKKFFITHTIKVGPKYLESLPKHWEVNDLLIEIDGSLRMVMPDGREGINSKPWAFIKSLDKGCKFTVEYYAPELQESERMYR